MSAQRNSLSLPQSTPKSCWIRQFRSNSIRYQHQLILSVYPQNLVESDNFDQMWHFISTNQSPQSILKFLSNSTILIEFDAILTQINAPRCTLKSRQIRRYWTNSTRYLYGLIPSVKPKILSISTVLIIFNKLSAKIDPLQSTKNPVEFDDKDPIWRNIGRDQFPSVYPKILSNLTISIKFDAEFEEIDQIQLDLGRDRSPSVYPELPSNSMISIKFDTISV